MYGFVIALTFVWVGLLAGISFMETPLKFHAPGITTVLAVGIGKLVFTALNRMELVLAVLIGAGLWRGKVPLKLSRLYAIPFGILLIQTFFLLPPLHARVAALQSGVEPPASSLHLIYVIGEIIKLIALIAGGTLLLRGLGKRGSLTDDN